MKNNLQYQTSPYLLQHADNPVEWYPWCEVALALAREQDKPILLSIGYSACHWCHVMAHESFEDPAIAAIMNEHFINIKVDREERPDIDQIYQSAHHLMSQSSGGWPLTVFLTPKQEPFYTGTYFPKLPRYQLPGFAELIPRVAAFYHERKDDLASQNSQVLAAMARLAPAASSVILVDITTINQGFEQLKSSFDFEYGGFGKAPKFPNPADITLLLHAAHAGNKEAEAMALQMLTAMANGGIYDHIGGGFCRYSVDERWNIPHFEKMLYDNGQLLFLYADAWLLGNSQLDESQSSRNPQYAIVVEETITWLQREMLSTQGAIYSSLDADSLDKHGHSEEGAFYVWQPADVKALLTAEEFVVASRCFGFDRAANFEGMAWHAYISVKPDADEIDLLKSAQTKLLFEREKRTRPGFDDKILTSWNALAIKGIARAGRVFNRPKWIEVAKNAVDYIRQHLWVNDRLLATCKVGQPAHLNAYLDDYAFLLDALLELMQADYRSQDMTFAEDIAEALLLDFESEEGGFYFTSHSHEALIHRPKQCFDNATPNGNGIAAVALQRLGHMLGEPRYLQSVERTLLAFDSTMQRNPAACASLLHALKEYITPPTLVIVRGIMQQMVSWQQTFNQVYYPHHLFIYLNEFQDDLPFTLNRPLAIANVNNVNAWICKGVVCSDSFGGVQDVLDNLK